MNLIVLDINGFLIDRQIVPHYVDHDQLHKIGKYYVYIRPGLERFLKFIFSKYDVAIYTSSMAKNVNPIIEFIFGSYVSKLVFIWYRDQTIPHPFAGKGKIPKYQTAKPIDNIKQHFPIYHRILLCDDCKEKMVYNNSDEYLIIPSYNPYVKFDNFLELLIDIIRSKI